MELVAAGKEKGKALSRSEDQFIVVSTTLFFYFVFTVFCHCFLPCAALSRVGEGDWMIPPLLQCTPSTPSSNGPRLGACTRTVLPPGVQLVFFFVNVSQEDVSFQELL